MHGTYSEFTTLVDVLNADGQTRDYMFLLHYDGSAPLRFDVGESVGLVELEALTIRSRDGGAVVSWSGQSLDTAPFRLVRAIRTSGRRDESFTFLCLNNDAHVYLDLPERSQFFGACQINLTVGFRVLGEESVQRAAAAFLREQSAAAAESAVFRAQVVAAAQAQQNSLTVTIDNLNRRLAETSRALESSAATIEGLERRALEADDRWQHASARLEASDAALAELRERSFRRTLEVDGLREALAKSETRLADVSLALDTLRRSRAYRVARRLFGRRGTEDAALAASGHRTNDSLAVSYSDLACLAQTPLFDQESISTQTRGRAAKVEPRMHYLCFGAAEGRDPSPWFKTAFYLAQYPDVAAARVNPLVHYVTKGASEGRLPAPVSERSSPV